MKKQYQKPEIEKVELVTEQDITAALGTTSINPFRHFDS